MKRKLNALHLFLVPLFIAIAGISLFSLFSSSNVGVLTPDQIKHLGLAENFSTYFNEPALVATGYVFAATILALLVASVGAVLVSIVIVLQDDERGRAKMIFLVIPVLLSVVVFVSMTNVGSRESTIDLLGARVFEFTLERYWHTLEFPLNLSTWADVTNALGISGAVFVAICVCAVVPKPTPSPSDATQETSERVLAQAANDLRLRMRWLKYLLFAASAVLVAAIANMQTWRAWPTVVLEQLDPKTADTYLELANSTVQFQAFMFVLILVGMFLPMAMWMRWSAERLSEAAHSAGITAGRSEWRQSHGLTLSFSENIQRVVALVLPILVGPVSNILRAGTELVV